MEMNFEIATNMYSLEYRLYTNIFLVTFHPLKQPPGLIIFHFLFDNLSIKLIQKEKYIRTRFDLS